MVGVYGSDAHRERLGWQMRATQGQRAETDHDGTATECWGRIEDKSACTVVVDPSRAAARPLFVLLRLPFLLFLLSFFLFVFGLVPRLLRSDTVSTTGAGRPSTLRFSASFGQSVRDSSLL